MIVRFPKLAILGLAALGLAACSTTPPATYGSTETTSAPPVKTEPSAEPPASAAAATIAAPTERTAEAWRETHPQEYVVQPGDTLWDIANQFLRDPWYWPEIWYNNPDIENPHLIYPGDHIALLYVGGERRLHVKWSPRIRIQDLPPPISTIPLDVIRPFLVTSQVLSEEELDTLPHIIASRDDHLVLGQGDTIYARPLAEADHTTYSILRKGDAFIDPGTGELLGYEAIHVGDSSLSRSGDPASLQIIESKREGLLGDLLKPATDAPFPPRFQPHAPASEVEGQIIHLVDAISRIARNQVAVINLGQRDGIEPGHVLAINQRGRIVQDRYSEGTPEIKLPDERAGVMMVFLSYEKVSYGLIMESQRPVQRFDLVTNP